MWIALVCTVPPTIAALAAWRGAVRPCPELMRVEAMVNEMLVWQITHERRHRLIEGDSK